MKKQLLFLCALLSSLTVGLTAQTASLTVANGTSTNAYVPLYGYWMDAAQHNQVVYPASMLADMQGATIAQLTWYIQTPSPNAWGVLATIKLAEVAGGTTLSSGLMNLPEGTATTVWQGAINGTSTTIDVFFDNYYTYNGGDLLIDITTELGGDWGDASFYGVNSTGAAYFTYAGSSTGGGVANFIPKTTFTYSTDGSFCFNPFDINVSNVSTSEATITWSGDASSYIYEWGEAGFEVGEGESGTVYEGVVTIEGLEPGSQYDIVLFSVCGDGSSDGIRYSFATPATPAEVPYFTSFEDEQDVSWHFANGANGWYIGGAASSNGSRGMYISNDEGATSGASFSTASISYAYRPIEFPVAGEYVIEFDWRNNGSFWYGASATLIASLAPGSTNWSAASANSDVTNDNWILVADGLNLVTTWQHATQTINIEEPGVYYLTFIYYILGYGGSGPAAAIDNINIFSLTCAQPGDIVVDNIGTESITISWTAGGEEESWVTRISGSEWVAVNEPSYTFTELSPSTPYIIEVAAYCNEGDTSLRSTTTVRTGCGIINSFPWTDNFDNTSDNFPCWIHFGGGNVEYYYDMNGGAYAEFYPNSSAQPNIFIAPEMENINDLELTFQTTPEGDASGSFSVGYVVIDETDTVFTAIETYSVDEWGDNFGFHEKTISLASIPSDARIAFRHTPESLQWYWFLDNIDVHMVPSCSRPFNLTLAEVGATMMEIAWSDTNESTPVFLVEYRVLGTSSWISAGEFEETEVTLEGLTPATTYEVRVTTLCSDEETSIPTVAEYRTTCQPLSELPYTNDFSGYEIYELFNDPCWSAGNNFGSIYDPEVTPVLGDNTYNAVYAITDANTSEYAYAMMPLIDSEIDIAGLELSFDQYGGYSGSYSRRVIVGLCGNQFDFGSYDTIAIFDGVEEVTLSRMVNFVGYTGEYRRIVFVFVHDGVADYDNYGFVGNVNLHLLPSCVAPTSLTVTASTPTTISVAITGDATATYRYTITDTVAGSTPVAVDQQGLNYTFTDLQSNHGYVISVTTVCEDELSLSLTVTAATTISGVDLPYTTSFEGADNDGWLFANGANGWFIGGATARTGDKALYISGNGGISNNYNNGTATSSYAYKAFNVNAGTNAVSFDWMCNGEGNYDYLRVFLVPANVILEADASNNIGTGGFPSGWVALDGGTKLNLASSWQSKTTLFEVSNDGVFYLVFYWRNDGSSGNNPPAAIDNVSLQAVTCHAPTELTYNNIGTATVAMSWTAGGEESSYHIRITDDSNVVVVNNIVMGTTYTTPAVFMPATHYNVTLRSVCGEGDTSLALHGDFYTECEHYAVPYYYGFEGTSLNVCWSNPASNAYYSWGSATANQNDHQIYTYAAANATPSNDWLISPVIDIPADDTAMLELVYYVSGWKNSSYVSSKSKYELRVSPTGSVDTAAFTDILTVEEMNSEDFQRRHFAMSQYAGQSVRFAFRSLNQYYGYLYLYEVGIRQTNKPFYYMDGDDQVFTIDTNVYTAIYEEGDTNNVSYLWTSTMADAGQAVIINADADTMQIVYNTAGLDTIMLVVTNDFGNDTVYGRVNIVDINPVTELPYITGFEYGNTDNHSWITANATNAWVIGNITDNGGSRSLYISGDNGASNEYVVNASSLSYVYRAFDISQAGDYSISFDWHGDGEGNYDFMRVWMVPAELFNVAANVFPGTFSYTSSLASGTVPGWLPVGGKLNQSVDWVSFSDTVNIQTPGRYLLTFLWANDNSVGHQPAAAIDNVVVNNGTAVIVCTAPEINSVETGETTATVSFSIPIEMEEGDEYSIQAVIMTGEWDDEVAEASSAVVLSYPADNTYTFTGLSAETAYTIGLRTACESDYTSEWVTSSFTTESHPCVVPTGLTISDINFDGATFTWVAGENETSWEVHVYNTTYDETFVVETTPTHTVSGLYAGTLYNVTVRAVCSEDNYSEWCDAQSFVPSVCEPVANVMVSNETNSSATVTWTAAEGQSRWEIEYGAQGHPQGTGSTIIVETNPYTITGLDEYTPYDLYVRAVCEDGNKSEWSAKATFTTLDIKGAICTSVKLYPNPATGSVTVSGIGGEAIVTVVDMNGRTVYTERASETLTIDLAGYSQGAYFVRISGEQTLAIRKLIVK